MLYKDEVRVHISAKRKFGMHEERNTDLAEYALGKPAIITAKMPEQKIALHKKDLIRKLHDDKKRSKRPNESQMTLV